ncbi:MAG: hypothetical protein QNL07_00405 [Candidatus Planktophila sp.]|jgi:hypothetical protein|tara:strand:- start:3009 stop:3785 length:777 start_codon:yes stop_codon:yes gene_type:complete
MASGIIYLVIIGMWVAYFLPRWVHDRNEFSGKSVERYKSALRIVASNSPGGSSGTGVIHTDLDREAKVAQHLMRRRIIFSIIIISFIMTIVGASMQNLAISFVGIPVLGFLLYLAYVRHQSNTERAQRRRVTQINRSNDGVSNTNLANVISPKSNTEHWIPLSERELTGVTILPKGTAAARGEWQPNSVPVPTYINAPKAITPKRLIDLTTPGEWSDEQERLEREALAAAAPSRNEIFDQQLADEAVERLRENRAANE